MNDLRSYSRHWLREFIEIYRSEECLWHAKHPEYNNNSLRNKAYEKLVEKLKEVETDPTKSMAVRKINSLRSAFRRELRKKRQSNSYTTRLWYFDLLYFIADQKYPATRKCFLKYPDSDSILLSDSNEEETEVPTLELPMTTTTTSLESQIENKNDGKIRVEYVQQQPTEIEVQLPKIEIQSINAGTQIQHNFEQNNQEIQSEDTTITATTSSPQKKDQVNMTILNPYSFRTDCVPIANQMNIRQEDEYDSFGKIVSSRLRSMKKIQRIVAEKLINDVLFNGQLETLNLTSKVSL